MATPCSVASGLLAVVTIVHVIFSVVLAFLVVLVRKETKKRKKSLVHPSSIQVNETAVQRRHGMVSPPRLAPEEEVEEVGLSATSSSSSLSHSQITVSNDKAIAVVKFHNEESIRSEPPVSLQEAGSLAMTGEKPVVLRHKKVSALKEEFGVTSALALKRTSSGPSTRKVSADVVMMQRTSSGSFIRRPPSRSSTGSAPKKSRFSVTSLLSRKSMDIESETANLILAGEDQEDGPDILQDDGEDKGDDTEGAVLGDDSTETRSRKAWSHKDKTGAESDC